MSGWTSTIHDTIMNAKVLYSILYDTPVSQMHVIKTVLFHV